MGVLSSKYPNVQAVEDALNKALESVNQTDFNAFKSNVYTKSETNDYTTAEKEKLAGIATGANKTVVDSALSTTSTNPVQNKVIKTSLDSKANSSDVYTKTESDSRFLNIDGTAKKAVADENGKNITESFVNVKSDIALNRTTLGYQRKNLLKPISGITRAGITYTVNEDGSVTLTGASTTGSTYNYFSIPITLKPGKYKVNGMPETSKTTTYRTDLRATESGGTTYGYGAKEFEVEFTETTTAYYMIRVDGSYKEELGGVTFYPMIRYAEIADGTYEPYQPSLQEQINALTARISALEGGV